MELKLINEHLKSINSFIDDVEQIFSMFSIAYNDYENRAKILELICNHNSIILIKKKDELKKTEELNKIIAKKTKEFKKPDPEVQIKKTIMLSKPNIEENEYVQIYIDLLDSGISIEEIMEDVFKKSNKDQIISQLLLRFYGDLKIFYEFKKEQESTEVISEINRINSYIEFINLIKDISLDESEENQEEYVPVTNYTVAFSKTNHGNIEFMSDLKNIDAEFYDNFKILLNSIIIGQPIGWKKISNHGSLKGINEVRIAECRIAYVFYNNYCVILHGFVKKTDVDISILKAIASRYARFNRTKKEQFNNGETVVNQDSPKILKYLDSNARLV